MRASPRRTRAEIADYLGLTIETVSRVFTRLKTQGVSVTPENLRIADNATLILSLHRELDGLRLIARPARYGKGEETLLDRAVRVHANDPHLWRLLSDCAASQKDGQSVFRARAEILFLTNRQKPAEEQMKNALRMARDNYSLTAQLERRLDEMRRLDAEFRLAQARADLVAVAADLDALQLGDAFEEMLEP